MILSSNITIKEPTGELLSWCQANLKLANPEYNKKARMGFWLGNTPKHLYLYEIRGGDLILPYGLVGKLLPFLQEGRDLFTARFAPVFDIDYGEPVPLDDYQQIAVEKVKDACHGILESRAGSGKTQMGIALIKEYGCRALWLTHTADLLKQSKERAERYMNPDLIGTITEGKVNIGKGVTFATVQTMSNLDLTQYKDEWDLIIVDECHRVAGTPTAVTMFAKVLNNLSARHKYGLSATVHRSDGMIAATYALLGEVVYSVPDEAVADRVMQVGIQPIGTGIGLSRECLNTDGTLNYSQMISYLCKNEERNKIIAEQIRVNSDQSCLVLSDRLKHLGSLITALPWDMHNDAVMISGKMTTKKGKAEREQAIKDMRTGKKKYLFATYSLAKEGLDIPCLTRLFLTTPQKDYTVITQSIGRIARVCEGKEPPICFDFVDNIGYLVKSYKKRCSIYKKNDCYFVQSEVLE